MFLKKMLMSLITLTVSGLVLAGTVIAAVNVIIPSEGLEVSRFDGSCINKIVRGPERELRKLCPPVSEQGKYPILRKVWLASEPSMDSDRQAALDDEFREKVQARQIAQTGE